MSQFFAFFLPKALLAVNTPKRTIPASVTMSAPLLPVDGSCAPVLFSTGTSGELFFSVIATPGVVVPLYV